jgi:hypothetical protein
MIPCHFQNLSPIVGQSAMSTFSKVDWIDRYRFRLSSLVPDLAPLDAASLAIDAFLVEQSRSCARAPEDAADASAAKRAAPLAPRLTACLY